MKVVHVSTTDFGGAYKAAERISASMASVGVDSTVLVRTKTKGDTIAIEVVNTPLKRIISKTKNVGNLLLSKGEVISDYFGTDISKNSYVQDADVVFLHWVNSFVSYHNVEQLIKSGKKIIWVMHDMWLVTGGCHYAFGCHKYENVCEDCPMIRGKREKGVSYRNYMSKRAMLRHSSLKLVGPSRWLVGCAKKSKITNGMGTFCIYNPIDTNIYYPRGNRSELREKFNIPIDRRVILFGAMKAEKNSTKGLQYLKTAIHNLSPTEYVAVVFGNTEKIESDYTGVLTLEMGMIQDEQTLAEIYNCADVFVAPSIQEAFGYTVNEALSCGTPVVGFSVGGISEQIEHKRNGYLARPQDSLDLAEGIRWCCKNIDCGTKSFNILKNDYETIGNQYKSICEELV